MIPLLVMLVIGFSFGQFIYERFCVDGDHALPLRDIITLSEIEPDKWEYEPITQCMEYKASSDYFDTYSIYPKTFIGYFILPYKMAPKRDERLHNEWIKDIERYRQKKDEETKKVIDKECDKLDKWLSSLNTSDNSQQFTSTITTCKMSDGTVTEGKIGDMICVADDGSLYVKTSDGWYVKI